MVMRHEWLLCPWQPSFSLLLTYSLMGFHSNVLNGTLKGMLQRNERLWGRVRCCSTWARKAFRASGNFPEALAELSPFPSRVRAFKQTGATVPLLSANKSLSAQRVPDTRMHPDICSFATFLCRHFLCCPWVSWVFLPGNRPFRLTAVVYSAVTTQLKLAAKALLRIFSTNIQAPDLCVELCWGNIASLTCLW